MSQWPRDNQAALKKFFGDPGTGEVERQLVRVTPPFKMYYDGKPIKSLLFHKKAAPALLSALNDIWDSYGHDQAKLDALGVSSTAGTYNRRKISGSSKWSNHAYGAAIDLDAERNGFGKGKGTIPQPVINAFKRQGFRWGGDYKGRTDPMHFEACDDGRGAPVGFAGIEDFPKNAGGEHENGAVTDDGDVAAVPEAAEVAAAQPAQAEKSTEIEIVQKRLDKFGYHQVGEIDGKWGGSTRGAISAFQNDRRISGAPLIDAALLAEFDKAEAEGWTKPIAKERAEATPEKVAEKIETVDAGKSNKLWSWVLGIPAAITAFVKGVVDNFEAALSSPVLNHVKDFFADNIALLALGVVGVAGVIWWNGRKTVQASTKAYQEGRLTS